MPTVVASVDEGGGACRHGAAQVVATVAKAEAFRSLARPGYFSLLVQRKVTKRKHLPRRIYSSRPGDVIAIATLGILPRVATARVLRAALRVSTIAASWRESKHGNRIATEPATAIEILGANAAAASGGGTTR
ncbi:hypothetical protein PAGU2638_27860 [Lysobacter sp. PAGU 2638]